jgi:hypothetical protein
MVQRSALRMVRLIRQYFGFNVSSKIRKVEVRKVGTGEIEVTTSRQTAASPWIRTSAGKALKSMGSKPPDQSQTVSAAMA